MIARTRTLGLIALVAFGTSACGDDGYTVERDGDVEVVDNQTPKWGEDARWHVATEPSLVIPQWTEPHGESGNRYHLSDAKRLPDGGFVIANGHEGQIGLFGRAGDRRSIVGTEGLEPGQFQSLRHVYVYQDALWAFDTMGRWNIFDLDGTLTASTYMQPHDGGWSWVTPYGDELAVLGRGMNRVPNNGTGTRRGAAEVLRYARTGAALGTLTTVSGREHYVIPLVDGRSTVMTAFARLPAMQGGRTQLYVGSNDAMEFDVYGPDAQHLRTVRVSTWDLSVSDEDWAIEAANVRRSLSFFEERGSVIAASAGEEQSADAASLDALIADMRPAEKPAYSRFLEDSEGNLWVAEFETRLNGPVFRADSNWLVFDEDGRWLGRVTTPEGLHVTEIGEDYVLGLAQPADRSEVRLYELRR